MLRNRQLFGAANRKGQTSKKQTSVRVKIKCRVYEKDNSIILYDKHNSNYSFWPDQERED